MEKNQDLLELLCEKADCTYISDLTGVFRCKRYLFAHIMMELDPICFPLKEWVEAVSYISGGKCTFDSITEAMEFLCGDSL